jgi:hypothetical protein
MRAALALILAAAALACGPAAAQGGTAPDTGAMCRSFCDADATMCRKESATGASREVDPLLDFRGPRADKDDFTVEKHQGAVRSADRDRLSGSQKCGDARLACRQRCAAPAVASASAAR